MKDNFITLDNQYAVIMSRTEKDVIYFNILPALAISADLDRVIVWWGSLMSQLEVLLYRPGVQAEIYEWPGKVIGFLSENEACDIEFITRLSMELMPYTRKRSIKNITIFNYRAEWQTITVSKEDIDRAWKELREKKKLAMKKPQ